MRRPNGAGDEIRTHDIYLGKLAKLTNKINALQLFETLQKGA